MNEAADLIVLGGGPAGSAAGIAARLRGLTTVVIETKDGPQAGPGETLHPGTAAIFGQLGVLDAVEAAARIRPEAQTVVWGAERSRTAYGRDSRGPWRGYQLARADLNSIMLDRFEELGGRVMRPSGPARPVVTDGTVAGVRAPDLELTAPFTIDSTGRAGILRRALGIRQRRASPPLLAHFGYCRGWIGLEPTLRSKADGWSWTAQIGPERIAWVRLSVRKKQGRLQAPDALAGLAAIGPCGARDATWRLAGRVAGPGFFLAGDAAAVLDPASSNGVLRALMSGMMAVHNAVAVLAGNAGASAAASAYERWITAWFRRDAAALGDFYARLGGAWACDGSSASPNLLEGSRHG